MSTFRIALANIQFPATPQESVTLAEQAIAQASAERADRIFIVNPGVTARLSGLTIANGFGFDLASGILNNGSLALDHCTVRDNRVGAVARPQGAACDVGAVERTP